MSNQFKVVMLPTETEAYPYPNLLLTKKGKLYQALAGGQYRRDVMNGVKPQHLYIVDIKATIRVGDWLLYKNKYAYQVKEIDACGYICSDNCKPLFHEAYKIIASTDKSLGLPEIPHAFIEAYVENQNIEITNVIKYSQNDMHIVLKPATREQFVYPNAYNQIPFTEQEQEDFKQVIECSKELQKQQMIEFISLEKQQELLDKWNSYSIDIQSAICSKILNRSSSDCYVDMNDLLYLDSIGIREQTEILVAKVKIVSLLTNNYFGECDYATIHEAHVTNIDYNVPTNTYTITLCRPGLLIGKGGEGYDRLCEELNAKIEIIEHKWY